MMGPAAGVGPLAQRASGLLVPAHLLRVPEEPAAEGSPPVGDARDADGRRRILLSRDARKRLLRLVMELAESDVAFALHCQTLRTVTKAVKDAATGEDVPVRMNETIPGACGKQMRLEGQDTEDPGFGCDCTRVHFTSF